MAMNLESLVGQNLGGMFDQMWFIGKLIFYLAIALGILFLIILVFSYKDKIIILKPRYKEDRGKVIKKRDGKLEYKLFRGMFGKKISIPPPSDDFAFIGKKGQRVFYCIQSGEDQYHFIKFPNKIDGEESIKVIPSDMYNWLIWRAKATRDKLNRPNTWQQVLLPVAVIVFIVMVSITFIYLFKEAPKSIAVSVTQTGSQMIPFG